MSCMLPSISEETNDVPFNDKYSKNVVICFWAAASKSPSKCSKCINLANL